MRDIPVGNGRLLINFDEKYQIRDIYFPHVGQENHSEGFPFRFGVWVNGQFSWVFSDGWERDLRYQPKTLVTNVTLTNKALGVELHSQETVASHENIFLRQVTVKNLSNEEKDVRIFLHHDFRIYENKIGDTAFFDPDTHALIHYKKHRYFLINTEPPFDEFATGRKAFREHEGTWRDAEDGSLEGGVITEGSVDSTIRIKAQLLPKGSFEFFYWIAAGTSYSDVVKLDRHVSNQRPEKYLTLTNNYWRAWVEKDEIDFKDLPPRIVKLFKRSLLIIRTQIDHDGAILAANDSDVSERATDHYSYLWTRDGAFVANALDLAGYAHLSRKFFDLCARIVHTDGYFLQKYNPDGTVASGWHAAWDRETRSKLSPIQEDETGLVLWALWEHYDRYRDLEFAYRMYKELVIPCANFMVHFRDEKTGLPNPSWNLWEDRLGIHTFTCSAVVGGLKAAGRFAELFGDHDRSINFNEVSDTIKDAMAKHLFSQELGRFVRSISLRSDGSVEIDPTTDASLFGAFYLGCFEATDERVAGTMSAIERVLSSGGGIARFENDGYMRRSVSTPGNAWFICTLWLAEYYIAIARSKEDLAKVIDIFEWTVDSALPSGVLAEQIDPITKEHVSVAPLTWSHSTFVAAVMNYLDRLEKLGSR